jgi:hypothetical protein
MIPAAGLVTQRARSAENWKCGCPVRVATLDEIVILPSGGPANMSFPCKHQVRFAFMHEDVLDVLVISEKPGGE